MELPKPTQQDCAMFDFIEGIKLHNYTKFVKTLLDDYKRQAGDFERERGYPPTSVDEAGKLIQSNGLFPFAASIAYYSQAYMWTAARDSLVPHTNHLLAMEDELRPVNPKGKLELNPGIHLPRWFTEIDTHLQKGGYGGDPLVAFIYQRGLPIFRTRWRKPGYPKETFIAFAHMAPRRDYKRILDMGCAAGGSTMILREAFPEAEEVIGIDLAAQALKWGHVAAERRGLAITLAQRDAADTGYPDESFDLVSSHFLYHETPLDVMMQSLREAYRLLKPGGHLLIMELPWYKSVPPEYAFLLDFDTWGNGEPFLGPTHSVDAPAILSEIGFADVREAPNPYYDASYWGGVGLMRTGEFFPWHRWVTQADKPLSKTATVTRSASAASRHKP